MFLLEEWFEIANRGTSGDMVMDILYAWKKDHDELVEQIKNLSSKSSGFAQLQLAEEIHKQVHNGASISDIIQILEMHR